MIFLKRNRPSNAELQHCKISTILVQFFIVHNVKFAETYFCTAWFISLENLHIYSKTYVFPSTIEGFRPKCAFRGCLSKYRRAFIVYMFRRPPEVWSLVSDNALISGTGKVGIHLSGMQWQLQRTQNRIGNINVPSYLTAQQGCQPSTVISELLCFTVIVECVCVTAILLSGPSSQGLPRTCPPSPTWPGPVDTDNHDSRTAINR